MGPKKGKPIPESALDAIHRVACIQMSLSDAYLFLAYLYKDDITATGFGAYAEDTASVKWFYARNILTYITERGSKVCIPAIQRPEIDTQGCIQCANAILNMEREITEILQDLQDFYIRDDHILRFTKELIFKQRRNEDRLKGEIEKLKTKEEQAQAEKKDDQDETHTQGSPRKKSRR